MAAKITLTLEIRRHYPRCCVAPPTGDVSNIAVSCSARLVQTLRAATSLAPAFPVTHVVQLGPRRGLPGRQIRLAPIRRHPEGVPTDAGKFSSARRYALRPRSTDDRDRRIVRTSCRSCRTLCKLRSATRLSGRTTTCSSTTSCSTMGRRSEILTRRANRARPHSRLTYRQPGRFVCRLHASSVDDRPDSAAGADSRWPSRERMAATKTRSRATSASRPIAGPSAMALNNTMLGRSRIAAP